MPKDIMYLMDEGIIGKSTETLFFGGRTYVSPTILRSILKTCTKLRVYGMLQWEREPGEKHVDIGRAITFDDKTLIFYSKMSFLYQNK